MTPINHRVLGFSLLGSNHAMAEEDEEFGPTMSKRACGSMLASAVIEAVRSQLEPLSWQEHFKILESSLP